MQKFLIGIKKYRLSHFDAVKTTGTARSLSPSIDESRADGNRAGKLPA
jgi:hypothetical protein